MEDVHTAALPPGFLTRLTQEERHALVAMGRRVGLSKGDFVFAAGAAANEVYILEEGRVKIFEMTRAGKEIILWFCFPGEIFGLSEVLRRRDREVYAQATSTACVTAIGAGAFSAFLKQHTDVLFVLLEVLSHRLRVLSDILVNVAAENVPSRLVKLLVRLGAQYGRTENHELVVEHRLTHQDLADMTGTTRQTVTTILGDLERQGLLKADRGTLRLKMGQSGRASLVGWLTDTQ